MYRPGQRQCGPPPPSFGGPPSRGPPYNVSASCEPSPRNLPPGRSGPFSSSAPLGNQFPQRPPGPNYMNVRTQHAHAPKGESGDWVLK